MPSMIEFSKKDHPLSGLWLWSVSYSMGNEAFSERIRNDIKKKTTMEIGNLDDWWVFPDDNENPIFTWPELIMLSLNILNCEATRIFVDSLYVKHIPKLNFKEVTNLINTAASGAKRVNANAGDYTDHSGGYKGEEFFLAQMSGKEIKPKEVKMEATKFRLSGKDESCVVEGTWLDWVMFACNVLADANTKQVCPEIYAPGLKNSNY